MTTSTISVRTDSQVKGQAEELFAELGLNLSTAVNLFLRQSIRERRIPFEVTANVPNRETVAAIEEGRRLLEDDGAETYNSAAEMRQALGL